MEKLFMCGRNSVLDAIKNKLPIQKIVILENSSFLHNIKKQTQATIEIKDKTFFEKYDRDNHQGVIAFLKDFPIYEFKEIEKEKPKNILVLDHLQDPHNFGAILRTANAFGIKFIIIPKERSVGITSTVLKVSSGGFINTKIIKVNNISATLNKLKKLNYWIYVSALDSNAKRFDQVTYNKPSVLVLGNEGDGVSIPVIREADEVVYIEQKGTVQSLNVSVAAGLLIYQLTKE